MKKILLVFLMITSAFSTIKADSDSLKSMGSALCITGLASAAVAVKLFYDHKKEQSKLTKILQNTAVPLSITNYDERSKKNFIRLTCGYVASLFSISTLSSGTLLLAYNRFISPNYSK